MYLVTLLVGGYFIALGQMSAADLAMYALYIGIFISPIQILVELTEMIQKGMSGFIRYQSVIDIEPEITDSVDAVNMKHPDGDICYHDVSFSYEDNEIVLNHIDFNDQIRKIHCTRWTFRWWKNNDLFSAASIL